jgi:mono/diheme cytochrome c family protein
MVARTRLILLLGLVLASCRSGANGGADASADARLSFRRDGVELRSLAVADLAREVPPETFTAFDPYYNKKKTYRALPLRPVLERGFAGLGKPLEGQDFVLRARDGYTVPLAGARLLEPGAYIAIADVDVPAWEPIGPQQANPGPFYFVWRGDAQLDLETHPRPWQLASIEIARFETTFPHTVPTGEPPGSPAMRGLATFRAQCIHCHAVNREGGRVGPDLNVPQSIVEYRPEAQIRAYIKDPLTFRYGNMPAHPHLGDPELDELVAYFRAMKDRKHDPRRDGGAP